MPCCKLQHDVRSCCLTLLSSMPNLSTRDRHDHQPEHLKWARTPTWCVQAVDRPETGRQHDQQHDRISMNRAPLSGEYPLISKQLSSRKIPSLAWSRRSFYGSVSMILKVPGPGEVVHFGNTARRRLSLHCTNEGNLFLTVTQEFTSSLQCEMVAKILKSGLPVALSKPKRHLPSPLSCHLVFGCTMCVPLIVFEFPRRFVRSRRPS